MKCLAFAEWSAECRTVLAASEERVKAAKFLRKGQTK